MKTYVITATLVYKDNDMLLVHHGPEYGSDSYWCLPGGTAEEKETALEAMLREVKEETGLEPYGEVKLAFLTQHLNFKRNWQSVVFTYAFSVSNEAKIKIDDPDQETLEVKFFTKNEAIAKMRENPFLVMREPLIDYLETRRPKIWTYSETKKEVSLISIQDCV